MGCNFLFHMAALKNDSATYVLQVFPTGIRTKLGMRSADPSIAQLCAEFMHDAQSADTFFFYFNGTRNLMGGLPHGSIWQNLEATDVSEVFTFNWTPEVLNRVS